MSSRPISIPVHGPPLSSAAEFFKRVPLLPDAAEETDLLKSIRNALRGVGTDPATTVHSTFSVAAEEPWEEEEELTWNGQTVVLSAGGIMRKKWNFDQEGQPVQWACIGYLEQTSSVLPASSHSTAHYTSNLSDGQGLPSSAQPARPTFGPFMQSQNDQKHESDRITRGPAIFVFLRSFGRVFLKNGLEYTFGLPFIVRKAWPLSPHGIMIQRVLEASEMEEAEVTGDIALPTIFSLTSPFAEATAVGLTSGIIGGLGQDTPSLKDEDENSTKPLKSIPATEMVVWASRCGPESSHEVVVTVDAEKHQLSIWRYVYIKPKDIPVPLGRRKARNLTRKRTSMSGLPVGSRRHSAMFSESIDLGDRLPSLSPDDPVLPQSPLPEVPELPPLSSLPGMPPSLSTTTTMASLVTGGLSSLPQSQWPMAHKGRNNSLTRNDLSVTMDRMVLGGRIDIDAGLAPIEHGRMRAAYWMEKLYSEEIPESDSRSWRSISVSLYDKRWDGKCDRSLMAICLPSSQSLSIFTITKEDDKTLHVARLSEIPAISAASIRATRDNVWDLLIVKPNHRLTILTHGLREIPLEIQNGTTYASQDETVMDVDAYDSKEIIAVRDAVMSSVTLVFKDGSVTRTTISLIPRDGLTSQCLMVLSLTLPADDSFTLHRTFLEIWSSRGLRTSRGAEFESFSMALERVFGLDATRQSESLVCLEPFQALSKSSSHNNFREDPAVQHLNLPPPPTLPDTSPSLHKPHKLLAPVLYALHTLGEDLRLRIDRYEALLRLAPVICRLALAIRPEWADYWKRLCPDATPTWPAPGATIIEHLDDRLPVWPPDMSAILYGRISNPDWKVPWYDCSYLAVLFEIAQSFEYGRVEPLYSLRRLTALYTALADNKVPETQKRAENAIHLLVMTAGQVDFMSRLPLGISAPLREAARTCQLSPPGDWPVNAYRMIGRNDLAAGASHAPDMLFNDGYRAVKDFINPSHPRKTVNAFVSEARAAGAGEIDAVSGVELDLEEFTEIRFGQDRRLEEVARMLCSSSTPSIKIVERPELNEHDQAKEQQHQVVRIAERTLALPYGRAMFTFGSVPTVTREAYSIPKLEYAIRMQPQNIVASPEHGKIPQECTNWGEFHNGVAAGLRISPSSRGVESSWIAFNKPSELTPEHAGFLFGLGLTGHLKEMLTWHTFGYLTPKHDLTSIGVLLGLSAANIGSGNDHVTKLLAVHTPALLPTPTIDLNVSLMTQAAGLAGVGLLYMGTKNRRMAEVCLNQISRKDLIQPDLSNEHREAYTYSAALAFGMIMLGKGSSVPADMALVSRLRVLIHGTVNTFALGYPTRPSFDINLTSPAASIALGLMYLKTERQDIADILAVPDTVVALNRIQPSFLLMRTIAKALVLWDSISPTNEWLSAQVPSPIAKAMETRFQGKAADDAMELAYYNILAGCCFVIGLKYAGTARQEAYLMIISYFDLFSRLVYSSGPAFDHKIKRSAIREGLNLISISLSMVMAGTGEITCFRRLRYAYGMYHQAFRYGIHVATHMSLGLLFLGGGRFTLGTSDAAVACMVTAFFPRFHHVSSDNKSYLQALRHLWVLAVEPRCLIARDVDTNEVVYLPVKISMKEGREVGTTQLIAPTLIPDLDKLLAIRVDTPRYWPFYLDTEKLPRHKENLLRSQTLYVKRRTAFLSYTEDPRGSRSLFVRSGSSAGDAATLDFPQLTDTRTHPASDLTQFITSFSNDILFLAFADHFSRKDGETEEEQLFHTYCHASLLDSILQDKTKTLQSHLTLYRYRTMSTTSRYFNLRLQDLRFAADFYSKIYDRRFSGRSENNTRQPLIRENTVLGAIHALDKRLDQVRTVPEFKAALAQYARGETVVHASANVAQHIAWYLLRNGVPVSTLLVVLKDLARDAHSQCLGLLPPEGTSDSEALDQGIKEVLHGTGTKMTTALGSGWSLRSLDEIIEAWKHT